VRPRLSGRELVFHLHNLAYDDRRWFADADAVLVPSESDRELISRPPLYSHGPIGSRRRSS
jgi:hypothetical protein